VSAPQRFAHHVRTNEARSTQHQDLERRLFRRFLNGDRIGVRGATGDRGGTTEQAGLDKSSAIVVHLNDHPLFRPQHPDLDIGASQLALLFDSRNALCPQ
jgi:hypothetical protein